MKTQVTIQILESEHTLACEESEKALLEQSAEVLNNHLRAFRYSNTSIDYDKMLMLGALQNTFELMREIKAYGQQAEEANARIQETLDLINRVEPVPQIHLNEVAETHTHFTITPPPLKQADDEEA